jgi:hypothetical protein
MAKRVQAAAASARANHDADTLQPAVARPLRRSGTARAAGLLGDILWRYRRHERCIL